MTHLLEGKRLVGYTRVSDTYGREDRLLSPEFQRNDIGSYSTLLGAEVTAWREDLDISGTTLKRPQFLEAVEMVENGEVDGLIVAKINRFARSAADAGAIVRRIEKAGGVFISVAERYDPTPQGKFMRTLFFAMAELEADIIRENWAAARRSAIDRGIPISPWIAAGFYKPGKREALVPHPEYAQLVVEAFERRANGQDTGTIAEFLTRHNVPRSKGGTVWTTAEVCRMLARRIYIGELSHGDVVCRHDHLALIDRATFEAVQAMVTPRKQQSVKRDYLLSGIVRCSGCGYAMRPHTVSAAMVRKGSAPDAYYYRCAGRHAGGICDSKANLHGPEADTIVTEEFFRLVGDVELESAGDGDALRLAEAELGQAESELSAFLELESALGGEEFVIAAKARKRKVDDARRQLAEVRKEMGGQTIPPVATLRDEWPKLSRAERRVMIASVVGCVMARRQPRLTPTADRLRVIPATDMGGIDLPRKGGAPALRPFSWN